MQGLQVKLNAGYGDLSLKESQVNPLSSFNPAYGYTMANTNTNFGTHDVNTWILEPQISWENSISKGKLSLLLGTTFQENKTDGQTISAIGFSNEVLMENMAAASYLTVLENKDAQYRYNAAFARINYNWQDKYLLNLTGRRDGSSRFGPGKQFANFGAIGIGWVFTKEKLFQNLLSFLSFGKLRGSYGTAGNDQIGDYGYLDSWTPTQYHYQSVSGLQPTQLYNPDYGWETTRKSELGLELGFLKERILFSAIYYQNRSSDQLVGLTLPYITGFGSIQDNLPATVQNTGWEFELISTNIRTAEFTWSMSANLTIPRNELVSFPNLESTSYANSYKVGQPLNLFIGYHYLGVNPQTGIYQFEDYNKDGQISYPDDSKYVEKTGIDYYGGLMNSFQYKSWKLDIFFQFVRQTGTIYQPGLGGIPINYATTVLKRWQKRGGPGSG
ncbi:MAG: hypothetical protein WDM78_13920 [Puia sp.]